MQASVQKIYMRSPGTAARRQVNRKRANPSAAHVAADVFEAVFFADVWGDLVASQADVKQAHDNVYRWLQQDALTAAAD